MYCIHLTEAITRTISLERKAGSNPQFLNVLTRPLTHRIIEVELFFYMKIYPIEYFLYS